MSQPIAAYIFKNGSPPQKGIVERFLPWKVGLAISHTHYFPQGPLQNSTFITAMQLEAIHSCSLVPLLPGANYFVSTWVIQPASLY
jgi:hypothetical protein